MLNHDRTTWRRAGIGADGVLRARAERGHARTVVTVLGAVRVRRIAYRSGVRGAGSLFPRDAVLSLPPCGYSWQLQRLAVPMGVAAATDDPIHPLEVGLEWAAASPRAALRTVTLDQIGADPAALGAACLAALGDL